MKVAIMQPYFFPYIGYFQLMKAVDVFVFYDDAQYMKGGWVNRNRVLVDGKPHWFTVPIEKAAHVLPINKRTYAADEKIRARLLKTVEGIYARAPFFEDTFRLVENAFSLASDNVAEFNSSSLVHCADKFGITVTFVASSSLGESAKGGQERVLDICRRIGATVYVNPIGGRLLYDGAAFEKEGIQLEFLRPRLLPYAQFGAEFCPGLSIIDMAMFTSFEGVAERLKDCDLLHHADLSVEVSRQP